MIERQECRVGNFATNKVILFRFRDPILTLGSTYRLTKVDNGVTWRISSADGRGAVFRKEGLSAFSVCFGSRMFGVPYFRSTDGEWIKDGNDIVVKVKGGIVPYKEESRPDRRKKFRLIEPLPHHVKQLRSESHSDLVPLAKDVFRPVGPAQIWLPEGLWAEIRKAAEAYSLADEDLIAQAIRFALDHME